jgi:alanine racemase
MFTWLEIDSRAITYNLREFKKILKNKALLMPVIKSNAYGHGFLNIAKICHDSPAVDRVCVVNLDEALELVKNKLTNKPILILSFFDIDAKKLKIAARNNIIFSLYSLSDARTLDKAGERAGKKIKIHIKIDTGTSRLGILPNDALDFVKAVKKFKHLEIEGLWSHFASSEDNLSYTRKQNDILNTVYENLKTHDIIIPLRHIACSAATINHSFSHQNAVRVGISLYGLNTSPHQKLLKLKPALSWYTTVIQVKTLPKGVHIGYGSTYITKKTTKLATLPIGYFDGYDRRLSNRGQVIIKGQICPIRGRICMNLCMVDVTNLDIKPGETVIIIGTDKRKQILVNDLAIWCSTINDEICSRINPSLPRITV